MNASICFSNSADRVHVHWDQPWHLPLIAYLKPHDNNNGFRLSISTIMSPWVPSSNENRCGRNDRQEESRRQDKCWRKDWLHADTLQVLFRIWFFSSHSCAFGLVSSSCISSALISDPCGNALEPRGYLSSTCIHPKIQQILKICRAFWNFGRQLSNSN